MTGKIAFVGDALQHGAKVGVQEVNAAGGVLGHPLKLDLQDTAGDTVDAVPAWHALELHNPVFELGPTVFTVASVIRLYGPAHLPDFMVAGATTYDKMNYPYVFRVTPSDSTMADAMAAYAIHAGYKHAAIIFDNGQNSQTLVQPLTKAYGAHGGQVVYNASVVPLQASYQSILSKVFNKHPDAVFFQTDPQTAGTIFHEMEQLGYLNVPIIATDNGASATFAKAMGMSYATKYMTGMAGASPSGAAYQTYVQGYKKAFNTDKPLDLSENTYDAVVIAALAMQDAKSTKSTDWLAKITDVSNPPGEQCTSYPSCLALLKAGKQIDYQGASGNEDFDQYHNVFGSWDVVRFDSSQNLQTVYSVSAQMVSQYASS
jgi:ABC-type branched-subunit amino acid transport system substrate-binding protein